MRLASLFGVLLLCAGCASCPGPGPTRQGIVVRVAARDKAGARRQAIESVLPLFLSPAARREKAPALEKAVFAAPKTMKAFIGGQKLSKTGSGVVEVRINALSAAVEKAGLVRPTGYHFGPETTLIALGDRAVGPTSTEHFAADALETALFGRGIQAVDADDELVKMKHPITAKTEAGTVSQAAAGGWAWLVTGRVSNTARHEVQSDSWRGRARFTLSLYGVEGSTAPASFDAAGEALDVSSFPAAASAIEAAAQEAAMRAEGIMARNRAGRNTIAILVSGYKDPVYLNRLIGDLRGIAGVEGAALISWRSLDDMTLIRAYAGTLAADVLAAKLLNADSKLRITAVETEDGRLTIEGPEIPASQDEGGEE